MCFIISENRLVIPSEEFLPLQKMFEKYRDSSLRSERQIFHEFMKYDRKVPHSETTLSPAKGAKEDEAPRLIC